MKKQAAIILLGLIIGAATANLFQAKLIDELYLENENLKINLYESTQRLHKLEEQLETHQELLIRDIKFNIDIDLNSFAELALKNELYEITSELIGEKIINLNPYFIYRMLEGRIIECNEEHRYKLTVNWIIIAEETTISLKCISVDE